MKAVAIINPRVRNTKLLWIAGCALSFAFCADGRGWIESKNENKPAPAREISAYFQPPVPRLDSMCSARRLRPRKNWALEMVGVFPGERLAGGRLSLSFSSATASMSVVLSGGLAETSSFSLSSWSSLSSSSA